MSKVIPFSRTFPSYHILKGKPTFFVEKCLNQFGINYKHEDYLQLLIELNDKNLQLKKLSFEDIESFYLSLQPQECFKSHTIRGGARFKVGEYFSPRVWFGTPYNTPQIIFAPDQLVESTFNFQIEVDADYTCVLIDNKPFYEENSKLATNIEGMDFLSKHDGLTFPQLREWFNFRKPFKGTIICWDKSIKY